MRASERQAAKQYACKSKAWDQLSLLPCSKYMQKQLLRAKRFIEYSFRAAFLEKPRGLDFSLRAKRFGIRCKGNHGYALTSKAALKNMLRHIPYQGLAFLDIGSGKGGPICFAYELGCRRCEGLEVERVLHERATRNIMILGYQKTVVSNLVDAREFRRYAEFDVYFLFNPFDDAIYGEVVNVLVSQLRECSAGKAKYCICYGAANHSAFQASSFFKLLVEGRDAHRGSMYRVYTSGGTLV
jgi:hypothetical protein